MKKYNTLEDFVKALVSATDENEDGNAMGIVVPDFGDDVVNLFVTPGSSFDTIIATKKDSDVQLLKNYNPYYALYWYNGEIPEDYYNDFQILDVKKYIENTDILACYLLDEYDIDQVLINQEKYVENPYFHRITKNTDFGYED